jgi:hypothetical protein
MATEWEINQRTFSRHLLGRLREGAWGVLEIGGSPELLHLHCDL